MRVFHSLESMRADLAQLEPVARTAVEGLVNHIAEHPHVGEDAEAVQAVTVQACLVAMAAHGWDPNDGARIDRWLSANAAAVLDWAVSVLRFLVEQQRKQQAASEQAVWDGVKVVSGVILGALLASIFG